jgi:hypothetical protein
MAVAGTALPTIAMAVKQPLFPDGAVFGVVFHLLSEVPHLVDDDWYDALFEHSPQLFHTTGEGSGGRLTQRRRDRRRERRGSSNGGEAA